MEEGLRKGKRKKKKNCLLKTAGDSWKVRKLLLKTQSHARFSYLALRGS